MMFLTVFLQFLAVTTAIRVPTAWPKPEPDSKVENAYLSDVTGDNLKSVSSQRAKADAHQINNREFYIPKLEHQVADGGYVAHSVQHKRRPSGSHVEFVTNSKQSQDSKRKENLREPDVSYSVHHPSSRRAPTVLHAKVAIKNNNHPYHNQNTNRNKETTKKQYSNPSNFLFSQPLLYTGQNGNFFTSADGWAPITGQHNPHKIQETDNVYVHHNLGRKHNQISDKSANRRQPPLNHRRQYTNTKDRRNIQSASNNQPTLQHYSVVNRNYRDDKTHEPIKNEESAEAENESEDLEDENEDLNEDDAEKIPISEHETPRKVPTKPNYPGEGLWAVPGLKHQPFPGHKELAQLHVADDEQPEGFETFQKAAPSFEKQHSKFAGNLQSFPQKHRLGTYIDDKNEETKDEDHEELQDAEEVNEEDEEEDSFIPTRTLAQVRKTENEEHLPPSPEDARLREVIKDSKIHTVYTEEGYEDIAYDHGGHEKNAEDSEGHAEFNKDAVAVKAPKGKKSRSNEVNILKEFENYEDPTAKETKNLNFEETPDADVSASSYQTQNPNKNMKRNKFAKTKENKTTKIKDMNDGDVEMEITSEVKIMTQPNNVSTAHKFVKIVPKNRNNFTSDDNQSPEVNQDSLEILKRQKRYVNDFPKIDVNKDFLDVLHVQKLRKLPVVTTEKYPYYKVKDSALLNKNSPLRYAEDLKNIPKKIPGRMSFYEQSRVSECPEIPRNVNPIPDRVNQVQTKAEQGGENEESGDAAELPDVPRLRNLGDKIDCLKSKLFGDNPLDSPFFEETVIEPPESIFKDFQLINNFANNGNKADLSESKKILNEVAAISQSLTSQADEYNNDYSEGRAQGEEEQEAEKFYSAADLNEEYADNDADYQTVNHEIVVPNSETTTFTNTIANNDQTMETLSKSTSQETFSQTTSTPSADVKLNNNFETTEKLGASVTTPEIKTLPPHFDERINFIPKHIYDQIDYSQNLDTVDTTSHASPVEQTHSTEKILSNIDDVVHKQAPVISEAPVQDQIVQTTEKTISSTEILNKNTTPFAPKNIYDQIDFLENSSPVANKSSINTSINKAEAQQLIQPESQMSDMEEYTKLTNNRQSKAFTIVVAPNLGNNTETTASNLSDSQSYTTKRMDVEDTSPETAALRIQRRRQRPKRPFLQVFDVTKFLPTPLPNLRPRRPFPQVFDVTKYLPKFLPTPLPTLPTYSTSTVMPKYKTLSEVYYKDDIKPNEQLNVFADVINNIKNSPPEVLHAEGSENIPAVEEAWNVPDHHKDTGKKIKVPSRKIRIKHNNPKSTSPDLSNDFYITTTTTTTTTTKAPRLRRRNKYRNHKPNDQIYEEYLEAVKANERDHEIPQSTSTINLRQKNKPLTTIKPKDSYVLEDTSLYKPSVSQDLTGTIVDDVLGLAPPFPVESSAVYPSLNYQNLYPVYSQATALNTFPVHGMKPPKNHKPFLYSDFRLVQQNRIKRRNNHHRIRKRSPYKPSYSEIRRNRPAQSSEEEKDEKEKEEDEEEEDDYIPKRNRNFHYDVENDRVVYTNKNEEEEESVPEPIIEEEEEEEGVEYLTLRPELPKPKFVVITTERNGPSFLEYVQQLKNDSSYHAIAEPTKKPKEEQTTKPNSKETESTTTKQLEAVIPEFLNIVSKLKSNDDYKEIKEKKTGRTTTASPEVEDEAEAEEIEDLDLDVRNSPGAFQNSRSYDRTQIFDISEYLPQPRDYIPKTVIDYSKYKTIERAPVATRHNLSSRYNAEIDDLALHNQSTTEVTTAEALEDNVKASSSEEHIEDNRNNDGETRRRGYSSSEETVEREVIPPTTPEAPEITTTRSKRVRMRGRKRPTTTTGRPTVSTTSPPSSTKRHRLRSRPTTTTTEQTIEEHFTQTHRTVNRLRSRPRTTTESALEENYSQTQRVVRRKHPVERYSKQTQKVPHNHKEFYTPISIEKEAEIESKPPVVHSTRKRKVSRLITPDQTQLLTNTNSSGLEEVEKSGGMQSRKSADVQVFRKYDPNQRHGGNYRREHEESKPQAVEVPSVPPTAYEIENSKEIRRLSDVVPKPFAFYSDPSLPKNVNQLKEPKAAEDLSGELEESELSSSSEEKTKSNEDYDEIKISFDKNSETVTKKSVYIVKDPSKRLYFYAPVK